MKFFINLHKKLLQLERFLLVSAFLTTLFIAVLQIILRNIFDTGIIWGDSFLRISVLWIGMLGALYASRQNNHISINLGVNFLPKNYFRIIKFIVHFFTAVICMLVAWYGLHLVIMEYEYAEMAFAKIPVWLSVAIIPIVFFIMSSRYFIFAILELKGKSIANEITGVIAENKNFIKSKSSS
ncbi:MAG: TRAP transporter small permease subunit [Proteobacteria bacterium]|nr:TRAP transporter small permease subunit [Pseudomonadota bacterium]